MSGQLSTERSFDIRENDSVHFCLMNLMMISQTAQCLNTNIDSNLETSGGQSSNLYLNVVHFFNASVN